MIRRDDTTCPRCEGDGFVITDWERFVQPYPGDDDHAAIADCPACTEPECDEFGPLTRVAPTPILTLIREFLRRWFNPTDAELDAAEKRARENGL